MDLIQSEQESLRSFADLRAQSCFPIIAAFVPHPMREVPIREAAFARRCDRCVRAAAKGELRWPLVEKPQDAQAKTPSLRLKQSTLKAVFCRRLAGLRRPAYRWSAERGRLPDSQGTESAR